MKRVIMQLPQGLRFDDLQPEQQAAIMRVFAQFTLPMPGTIPADGYELVDGVTGDNFDPAVMDGLGMPWPVLGMWQWDGRGELVEVEPYRADLMLAHLPPVYTYDDDGNVVSERPQTDATLPHNWAGWPQVHVDRPL